LVLPQSAVAENLLDHLGLVPGQKKPFAEMSGAML
jgi:hypothetical protein